MKQISFLLLIIISFACNAEKPHTSNSDDFNFKWKFHLGDIAEASEEEFNDSDWRTVRLPHDWSVEHSFTMDQADGATAYLPGGIGWYRKQFKMDVSDSNKVTSITFDGIYTNSEVWINGHYLGKRPYGYSPFVYDLTPYLKYGNELNVIAVKADRSAYLDCRWYPGSGIYRKVKFETKNQVHIPQWGTFVTTPKVNDKVAEVNVQTSLVNRSNESQTIELETAIYNKEKLIQLVSETYVVKSGDTNEINQSIKVKNPLLWDTENPHLYVARQKIVQSNGASDSYSTTFGIRSFHFDREKGFFLNGKNTLLKGVCLHHDGGLVGAAVPDGVWERRLQKLKDAGCNAIRTAHNPPSGAFLDLCDQMGFLVQDEAFDEFNNPKDKRNNYNQQKSEEITRGYTEHFTEWSERDIKNMVMRDRNHPSIIMWSIGNEIEWTYPEYGAATGYWGNNKVGDINYYWDEPALSVETIKSNFKKAKRGEHDLAETAQNLSAWVKEIDTTRPVTANLVIPSVSNFSGYADALDIVGLSYRQAVYDYCYENYPEMIFLGTENWTQWHEWKPVIEKDFISGIFIWTGIDYMGESREWPKKGSGSGLLDFAGFEKPSYHMFKTLWTDEPHTYITTQLLAKSPYKWNNTSHLLEEKTENWAFRQKWGWQDVNEHWNYSANDSIAIEVYTNEPEVELFLNGSSLGTKKLSDHPDRVLRWMVLYQEGTLTAKSVNLQEKINTSSVPAAINIMADKKQINADGYEVVHITAQLIDENGTPVKHEEREITFTIDGDIKLLGVDNGSPKNIQDYQNNKLTTNNGKCLLILQSNLNQGSASISAHSSNLESETINIKID